eukprot:TRINITY_DN12953_c0_g1_i10.p1 TRINITY_DN12953_c0_g1~~TRINITY_DN12953_c0_g1_i10.p1  ORF type:complete len:135 (-),score=17.96 TRINITY_DN12953_c0_g1_i10:150-554(-)
MDPVRVATRIILGLILAAAGVLLLIFYDPSATLPLLLERLPLFKALKPYHVAYFRANASLFCVSGLFTVFNVSLAALVQFVAALMFCLTFDNFSLYCSWELRMQKIIYIICHIAIIAAICECQRDDKVKKVKAE